MKNFKLYLLFFCALLPATCFSAHIVGSSMSYQYLYTNADGTKTWKFDVTILRDCAGNGAPFDDPMQIGI
jgi:hypothetical protein